MNEVMCSKPFHWNLNNHNALMSEIKLEDFPEDDFDLDNCSFNSMPTKETTIPTAEPNIAAASLQTAFCRKPAQRNGPMITPTNNNKTSDEGFIRGQFGLCHQDNGNSGQENTDRRSAANSDAGQQTDMYRDLIFRHLIQDICATCAKLAIPTDPYRWTAAHGSRWIEDTCNQFNLPVPRYTMFTGEALFSMTIKDFMSLSQEGGDTLHAQLQVWKTAFEAYHNQPQQQCNNGSNSLPPTEKQIWNEMPKTNRPTDFGQQFANSMSMPQAYYGNCFGTPPLETANYGFFNNAVMPSPCNSETSSNSSNDMDNDDLMNILQMPSSHHPMSGYHDQRGLAQMGMGIAGSPCDEHRPSPFSRNSGTVHLWHFIRELLDHPKMYGSCVRWVDREEGTFKIESSHHLARFWGQRKNRSQMNYDKLSRSLRQYYKKGIIQKPERKQRLVYKFLPPYNL